MRRVREFGVEYPDSKLSSYDIDKCGCWGCFMCCCSSLSINCSRYGSGKPLTSPYGNSEIADKQRNTRIKDTTMDLDRSIDRSIGFYRGTYRDAGRVFGSCRPVANVHCECNPAWKGPRHGRECCSPGWPTSVADSARNRPCSRNRRGSADRNPLRSKTIN